MPPSNARDVGAEPKFYFSTPLHLAQTLRISPLARAKRKSTVTLRNNQDQARWRLSRHKNKIHMDTNRNGPKLGEKDSQRTKSRPDTS
jgi:hypothetical protein